MSLARYSAAGLRHSRDPLTSQDPQNSSITEDPPFGFSPDETASQRHCLSKPTKQTSHHSRSLWRQWMNQQGAEKSCARNRHNFHFRHHETGGTVVALFQAGSSQSVEL